jgi:tectonin-like protein/necrosis inducing protein (NPP1)
MKTSSRKRWLAAVLCGLAVSAWGQSMNWKLLPGAGNDIGVGPTGQAWVIGTDQSGNDYGIYRLDGAGWTKVPGGAVRIDVGPNGPWVVNSVGGIYSWNGGSWTLMPGAAKDVGIGANGTVWVIGTDKPAPNDYGIYRWAPAKNNWDKMPGWAVRIDVDPQGNAWVVNSTNNIFKWNGSAWQQMPGAALDVGIGSDGTVYIVGTDQGVYRWTGSTWEKKEGALTNISVDNKGNPWGVNAAKAIYAASVPAASAPGPAPPAANPLAVRFAPLLNLTGNDAMGYPMSAQAYYDQMKGKPANWRLENTNRSTLGTAATPTYYRITSVGKQTRIYYWWFYGFQHPCTGDQGQHNGDWEHVVVTLSENQSQIAAVTFYQHDGFYTRIAGPRDAPCTPGGIGRCDGPAGFRQLNGRPLVYVGAVAHGSYHDTSNGLPGPAVCTYYGDQRAGSVVMDSARYLVDLDGKSEAWLSADNLAWGPDGVNTHPTAVRADPNQPMCVGNVINDLGSKVSITGSGPGCFKSECLAGDDQAVERCIKECEPGYTNTGLTCGRGKWPWDWSVYGRLNAGKTYGYAFKMPTGDAGLLRRRNSGGEWNLP